MRQIIEILIISVILLGFFVWGRFGYPDCPPCDCPETIDIDAEVGETSVLYWAGKKYLIDSNDWWAEDTCYQNDECEGNTIPRLRKNPFHHYPDLPLSPKPGDPPPGIVVLEDSISANEIADDGCWFYFQNGDSIWLNEEE